jgi:hypothetical protein
LYHNSLIFVLVLLIVLVVLGGAVACGWARTFVPPCPR